MSEFASEFDLVEVSVRCVNRFDLLFSLDQDISA